jgi:hypothetical protein
MLRLRWAYRTVERHKYWNRVIEEATILSNVLCENSELIRYPYDERTIQLNVTNIEIGDRGGHCPVFAIH